MSYKDEIKTKLAELSFSDDNKGLETHINDIIKTVYRKALDESKKTGQSVESITYEILEGLEESLNSMHKNRVEDLLHSASQTITNVIHRCAQENISHKNKNVQRAINHLQDTIEAEKAHLLESMEAFKAYAHDHTHTLFAKNLHHLQEKLTKMIHTVTERIKEDSK
jgi:transcription initiation factor TFIIIB Brf1 subunit/transcription initiation factor TFIIB